MFTYNSVPDVPESNDHILKSTSVLLTRPVWDDNIRIETVFRPTGPLTPDKKGIIPYRNSDRPDDFSQWIIRLPVFKGGSVEKVFFIAATQDEHGLNTAQTPATKFLTRAKAMCKDDRMLFATLCVPAPGQKFKPLPTRLHMCTYVQGILVQHAKVKSTLPRWDVVLELPKSASDAFITQLNQRKEGVTQGTYDDIFVYGDVIHADTGKLVKFYNPSAGVATQLSQNLLASASNAQKERALSTYACEIPVTPVPIPRQKDGTLPENVFRDWETLIHIPTEKEIVDLLCQAFADIPQLLQACLREYSDWLPKFVKGGVISQPIGAKVAPDTSPFNTTMTPNTLTASVSTITTPQLTTSSLNTPHPETATLFDALALKANSNPPVKQPQSTTSPQGNTPTVPTPVIADSAEVDKKAQDILQNLQNLWKNK